MLLTHHLVADFTVFAGHEQIETGQYNGVVPVQRIRVQRWIFGLLPFAEIAQEPINIIGPGQALRIRVKNLKSFQDEVYLTTQRRVVVQQVNLNEHEKTR